MHGMQEHEYPRLKADPKKNESKNNGNFYAGSGSKGAKKGGHATNTVSTVKRNSNRGNYAK